MAATTNPHKTPRLLWKHPHPETTQMYRFKTMIEKKRGLQLPVRLALP